MILTRVLLVFTLTISIAFACKYKHTVIATGDWTLDAFNVTGTKTWDASEPLGVMHLGDDCVHTLIVENLIPHTKYSWKVAIDGSWKTSYGCKKNAEACTFVAGDSGEVRLYFDSSAEKLTSEVVAPDMTYRIRGPQCGKGKFCHFNNCRATRQIWQTNNGGGSNQVCNLAAGKSCTTNVANGWSGNFKCGQNGKSLAEFTIAGWQGLDYYDVSYIVGCDVLLKIQPPSNGMVLNCNSCDSPLAYHHPNDKATHTVKTGGQHIITYCP